MTFVTTAITMQTHIIIMTANKRIIVVPPAMQHAAYL